MVAPGYSERRSGLAKQLGLGRGRRAGRTRNPSSTTAAISAARKAAISGDGDLVDRT
jgi:predicted transcriptional regulator